MRRGLSRRNHGFYWRYAVGGILSHSEAHGTIVVGVKGIWLQDAYKDRSTKFIIDINCVTAS